MLVSKDRLYFDQYEYCLNFKLEELAVLRELDHSSIDRDLVNRADWRQRTANFGGSWRGTKGKITEQHRVNCHAFCDVLLSKQDYKLIIYSDWGYMYSNDLVMLRQIEQLSYLHAAGMKRVHVDIPRGSILIKSSKHQYRSYFHEGRVTADQRDQLRNFLANQQDIRTGPGLQRFLNSAQSYYYMNPNMFIDHNGQGIVTMLGLMMPRAIRKTLDIVSDK